MIKQRCDEICRGLPFKHGDKGGNVGKGVGMGRSLGGFALYDGLFFKYLGMFDVAYRIKPELRAL